MQTTQTTGVRLYAVLGLLFVSSAMILLLPFFPPGLQWLFALLFWAPLVAAYVLLRQLDRRRRSQPEPRRRQKPPKPTRLRVATRLRKASRCASRKTVRPVGRSETRDGTNK